MNPRTNLDDRLGRHLGDAAAATRLRPGSVTGVVRTARRRTARRRQVAAAASVVAVGGVTVVGVQQLSGSGGEEIAIGGPGVEPGPGSEAPAVGPRSVRPVEPRITWRAIRPDSAAAVGTTLGSISRFGTTFPGVIVSTAPAGSDAEGLFRLWQSDDGVTFDESGTTPPAGSLMSAATIGTQVYAFGTSPGVAATEPNPLLASMSDDSGATWQELVLPVDTHELRDEPAVDSVNVRATVAETKEAGTLIAVTTHAAADLTELVGGAEVVSFDHAGIQVAAEGSCFPEATATSIAGTVPPVTEPPTATEPCATVLRTWDDLGVSQRTVHALTSGLSTLLHSPDGFSQSFSELAPPPGSEIASLYLPSSTEPIVVSWDGPLARLWRLTPDLTWTELPMPPGDIYTVTHIDGRLTAVHANGDPNQRMLGVSTFHDGRWETVELTGLADGVTEVVAVASGDAGLALAVLVVPAHSTTDTVPTSTSILPAVGTAPPESLATDTTQPVQAADADERWLVLHTVDAVDWSVEDLDELLGPEVAGRPYVDRIASVGNQLVISVSMYGTESTPAPQIVLVGTPDG